MPYKKKEFDFNKELIGAVESGDLTLAYRMIDAGATNLNEAMMLASRKNYEEIFDIDIRINIETF